VGQLRASVSRKPKLMMRFITPLIGLVLLVAYALAQERAPLEPLSPAPTKGTFWSVQRTNLPPLPFDLFGGQLPIYELKPGVFIIDDSQVDFTAMEALSPNSGESMSMSGAPEPCDPCATNSSAKSVTNAPAYGFDATNVWLEITGVTNGQAYFVVRTPDSFETYDMFGTTNLNLTTNVGGLNRTNWVWLMRTAFSQTNLVLTNLWPSEGWFKLGTMLDSDSDGLPDAFEIIVSKTKPHERDSDSDGIADGDEMGPNGLPWSLEQARRNSVVVYANTPTATEGVSCGQVTVHLPEPAPVGGVA
jgi:hypothetical protein